AAGSRTPWFRRWVAARAVPGEQRRWRAEVDRAAARLDAPLGARLRALEATLEEVARLIDQQPPGDELGAAKGRLAEVLRAYATPRATTCGRSCAGGPRPGRSRRPSTRCWPPRASTPTSPPMPRDR